MKSAFRVALRSVDYREKIKELSKIPDEEKLKLGEAQALNLTIMYIDIVNFTGISANNTDSQQRLLIQLDFLFNELFRVVLSHGGKIEKNTGDGLMAYFDNADGKESVVKAIESALLMTAMSEHITQPIFRSTSQSQLEFRITIDYGLITIARIGLHSKFRSLVAIGKTANLAAKIQEVAGANEIVLGRDAYKKLPEELKKFTRLHKPITYNVRKGRESIPSDQKVYATHIFKGRWSNKNGFFK